MKIKATTPCYKFIDATSEAQIDKIREEVEEVDEAWAAFEVDSNQENLKNLLMELLDVKACVNTAMVQIEKELCDSIFTVNMGNLDFRSALNMEKEAVVQKNMRRGYYLRPEEGSENHE